MIDAILTNTMLPQMSIALLERKMMGGEVERICIGVDAHGFTYDFALKPGKKLNDHGKKASAVTAQPTGGAEAEPVPAE